MSLCDDRHFTIQSGMTSTPMIAALQRAERLLFESPVLESFIARREAGVLDDGEHEMADDLGAELIQHQSTDGSWGNSLRLTAEALLLLAELAPSESVAREAVAGAIAWLRTRQSAPGSFADGCTPDAHVVGLCHHFATGFFSPAPPEEDLAGTTLANGLRLATDEDARLALSALALRAILAHRQPGTDDLLHADALRRVAALLFHDQIRITTPATAVILATLTQTPRNTAHLAAVHGALSRLVRQQRADGSWPGADMFHIAETLLLAIRSGYGSPAFDAALTRTADLLVLTQQPDGAWGQDSGIYRLLTGWRTLRHVSELQGKS